MKLDKTIGPELHRIKPLEKYDEKIFTKLYKLCKPVIKNLVKQIDCRRYNVSKDVINSYFWDKMLFLFNRYYEESEGNVEFLKAHILRGLSTYKYHLLQEAYSERAEYFQSLTSLDELYDNNKEDVTMDDDSTYKEELLKTLYDYMSQHLSPDAILVFECLMTPTAFLLEKTDNGRVRITNAMLAEFFNLPKAKTSIQYISDLRHDVEYWEQRAMKELSHK
jgi:hypothetical protein